MIIDMQGEVQYEAHRLGSPERIYIDLHDTALAPGMFGKTIEIGDARLERVRIAQPKKGISRVVLETTGASDFSVSLQSNPYRLVVEIRKRGAMDHARPGAAKNRCQTADRAPAGDPCPDGEQTGRPVADAGAKVPSSARCRPRRLGPGNRGTQGFDGKGRRTGYRAPPG